MTTLTQIETNLANSNITMNDFDKNSIISTNMPSISISKQTSDQFNLGVSQTINSIKDMQTSEMKLYTSLDNPNLTSDERSDIIKRISQIEETKSTLYNSLNNMAASYQQNVTSSQNTIQQQMFAIDIVENELNEAKMRTKLLADQKNDKLRLVEINTYYGKRFNAHTEIVKVIIYVCILMLITIILGKKGILPTNVYITLNGTIIVIGAIVIGKKIIDLSNRDNMNFDEYDWYFDRTKAPSDTSGMGSTTSQPVDPWTTTASTCTGPLCCDPNLGLQYDSTKNACVKVTTTSTETTTETTPTTTTETMKNMMNPFLNSASYLKNGPLATDYLSKITPANL
jgi:hypothetical protein